MFPQFRRGFDWASDLASLDLQSTLFLYHTTIPPCHSSVNYPSSMMYYSIALPSTINAYTFGPAVSSSLLDRYCCFHMDTQEYDACGRRSRTWDCGGTVGVRIYGWGLWAWLRRPSEPRPELGWDPGSTT
jgi:hypothetical protein